MNKHPVIKVFVLFGVVLFVLACELPVLVPPAASGPAPGSVETIVFETAAAAQTQTAIFLPPASKTPTAPPLPTGTPTETPTATATVIFILPTSTKPFEPYNAGSQCRVVAQTPVNNAVLKPSTKFDAQWTFRNTGKDLWLDNSIDFKYTGGTDMHRQDIYDMPNSIAPSGEVTLTVPMTTPKNPGTYTTNWVLMLKKKTLCKVALTITVK